MKKKQISEFKLIDLHSHILPGIDDGSPDFDTSLAIVMEMARGGVTDVFATSHYVDETIYTSPRSENLKLLKELSKRLSDMGVDVNVHIGNEIYVTPNILELLKNHEVSTLGDSKYLLMELPISGDFPGYADIFLELIRAGYNVILAHPERYLSFQKDFDLAVQMVEMGVLLQCNVGSFIDQYGKTVRKTAVRLAKSKMIWGLGTDTHHLHGDSFIPNAILKLSKYYDDAELEKIMVGNAKNAII
ncbi:hypothetical protein IJ076_03545 [Candidatus Saccharibacteria bacterium]|nr:hypothetical protein [Candidatus Saccharibacteria bacterium]